MEGATLEEKFRRAADHVTRLAGSLSQDQLLLLYGRYKQAIVGDNTTEKPSFIRVTDRRKWEAWTGHRGKSQEKAMEEYITTVEDFDPDFSADVELDNSLGNEQWVRVSSLANQDAVLAESEKTVFDWVKENNGGRLRQAILAGADMTCTDEDGMSLLHWAADRGHAEVAELLLRAGNDAGARDADGQTPLHYAASCGHEVVVKVLMAAGADPTAADEDGCTPVDVAPPVIKEILLTK